MVTIAYLPSNMEAGMEVEPIVYGYEGKVFFYFWLIWLG